MGSIFADVKIMQKALQIDLQRYEVMLSDALWSVHYDSQIYAFLARIFWNEQNGVILTFDSWKQHF